MIGYRSRSVEPHAVEAVCWDGDAHTANVVFVDLEGLCDDGEMIDGLVRRFGERVAKGMMFGETLMHLEYAQHMLSRRMNAVADVMENEARLTENKQ